jgi:hypothetical protein
MLKYRAALERQMEETQRAHRAVSHLLEVGLQVEVERCVYTVMCIKYELLYMCHAQVPCPARAAETQHVRRAVK